VADRYLLDTSAILAFTDQEPGSRQVERILTLASAGACSVEVSALSLMEIFYVTLQERGEDLACLLVVLVKKWPVAWVYPDETILLRAGRVKAGFRLSLADAIIAATAIHRGATLVHKDPELAALDDRLALLALPSETSHPR